ncbi:MAG: hypothetical protein EBZ77_13600, partial [Chitinophagia bacterium]|nr:hypothetical protein [Chitinophagia bacterium]
TTASEYQLKVSCISSGTFDTSNVISVSQKPFYLCYCSPLTNNLLNLNPGPARPDSVNIRTTSLTHSVGPGAPVYAQYFPPLPTATGTVTRGSAYDIYVRSGGTDAYNVAAWVDYNRDGTFGPTEYVGIVARAAAGSLQYNNFTIPTSADTGITGLRIRTTRGTDLLTSPDACNERDNGATADYVIRIDTGNRCTGRPGAGYVSSSAGTVCPSLAFTLSDSGAAAGRGISYQWISSAPSGTVYSTVSGGTSTLYTAASQTTARDYRLVVTCSFSGLSDTSGRVTVGMKAAYMCSCSPFDGHILNDSPYYAPLDSFGVNPGSISDNSPGDTNTYMLRFPVTSTTTTTLLTGNSYVLGVKSAGTTAYEAAIWIDYNQNGTYETSEYTRVTNYALSGTVSNATVAIPAGTTTGNTALRVRVTSAGAGMGAGDACTRFTAGVTRDYIVNIATGSTCTGTPTAGIASTPSGVVCHGVPFSVSALGYSPGIGIALQWYQLDIASGSYTALAGATSNVYRADSLTVHSGYQLVSTCTATGRTDTTNLVDINFAPAYLCGCRPATGTLLNSVAWSAPLDTVAINGTSLANYTPGNDSI